MAGIFDGEGDADGENNDAISVDADQSTEKDKKSKKQKVRQKSPIKSRWLISIVKAEVSQRPNIPNKELKALLKDYVKDIFLTPSLLQRRQGQPFGKKYLVMQTPMSCMSQPFRGCCKLQAMTLSCILERRMMCCANVRRLHSHSIFP